MAEPLPSRQCLAGAILDVGTWVEVQFSGHRGPQHNGCRMFPAFCCVRLRGVLCLTPPASTSKRRTVWRARAFKMKQKKSALSARPPNRFADFIISESRCLGLPTTDSSIPAASEARKSMMQPAARSPRKEIFDVLTSNYSITTLSLVCSFAPQNDLSTALELSVDGRDR
jgi:hypothetical protein